MTPTATSASALLRIDPGPWPERNFAMSKFRVGRKHTVTMSLVDGAIRTIWEPRMPRKLNKAQLRDYRAGREAFVRQVAGERKVLVVEV